MWKIVLDILKKAAKYGAVAFTGYEIGDKLNSEGQQQVVHKETTIIKEQQSASTTEHFVLIIIALLFFGLIIASISQIFKCIHNKNKNKNSVTANIYQHLSSFIWRP